MVEVTNTLSEQSENNFPERISFARPKHHQNVGDTIDDLSAPVAGK